MNEMPPGVKAPNNEAQLCQHILSLVQEYADLTMAPKTLVPGVSVIPPLAFIPVCPMRCSNTWQPGSKLFVALAFDV
jgi:hypothetical protein